MLRWLRDRRRNELISSPFPEAWIGVLQSNVSLYQTLSEAESECLRADLRIFLAEKFWEGCGGQEITDEIKVTISAHACFLMLGLDHDYFPNVESILVYPTGYVAPGRKLQPGGVIDEGPSARLGEAWSNGPVVLSWQDVLHQGKGLTFGRNVTLHEFAHKLDMAVGSADGVPRLQTEFDYDRWSQVMSTEYEALQQRIDTEEHGLLDPYAATNPAEFFAVATETFFEAPERMRSELAELYAALSGYYYQNPAARVYVR